MILKANGTPALFIPGNAGSSQQVRSIASSAARQYYSSPGVPSPLFTSRGLKSLDVFAVEFNEDLSAFHGPTLLSQKEYTKHAISFILSRYPPGTQIVLIGHSMGGLVARSLLPSKDISAVIAMSTPNGLAPSRHDGRIESLYSSLETPKNGKAENGSTVTLAICGGAKDSLIPSETCHLPPQFDNASHKTVITTALDGIWSSVGHLEMAWCHQVRWRVARLALEIQAAHTISTRRDMLDTWFSSGTIEGKNPNPTVDPLDLSTVSHSYLEPHNLPYSRSQIFSGTHVYLIPSAPDSPHKITILLARASVGSIHAFTPSSLRASLYWCQLSGSEIPTCTPLSSFTAKLHPLPLQGQPFPIPNEGVDEAEGLVSIEASINGRGWLGVRLDAANTEPKSWMVIGATSRQEREVVVNTSKLDPFWTTIGVRLPADSSLKSKVKFTGLLSDALVVYRLQVVHRGDCSNPIFTPLLHHTVTPVEGHYHPLFSLEHPQHRPVFLHSHSNGPYIVPTRVPGVNLTIFDDGICTVDKLNLSVDFWASFGRIGLRYWGVLLAWSIGVVTFMLGEAWGHWGQKNNTAFLDLDSSLRHFTRNRLPQIALVLSLLSCLPLPDSFLLGNAGEVLFAPLAPLFLVLANGLVWVFFYVLHVLLWLFRTIARVRGTEAKLSDPRPMQKRNFVSIIVLLVLVLTVIPFQVAFLISYLAYLWSCATIAVPRMTQSDQVAIEAHSLRSHMLLLFLWLLPVVAPVLVVWIRTIATAGFSAPFDGDHNVLHVAFFLALMEWQPEYGLLSRSNTRTTRIAQLAFFVISAHCFLLGGRYTYGIFNLTHIAVAWLVVAEVRPWTRISQS